MLDCPQFAARSDYSQEAVADMLLKKNENWGIASIEKLGVIFVYFFSLGGGSIFFCNKQLGTHFSGDPQILDL